MVIMYTFNELVWFAKAQGHKYIKRIPVGTTASGRTRYRYIYSTTSTVGGKHLLDEAHLKVGTKLMLHSKSGEEVHAHIESVYGNKVTIRYDDGDKKGQTRTVSKKDLLKEFNEEHGVGKDLKEAHESAKQDLKTAKESGATDKQLKRIQDRIDRTKLKEEKKVKKEKKQEPVQAINDEARKILESYGDDYNTEIKDYNLLASQNLDFKGVDKALSKPIYDDAVSTVYELPNGTMIAVGKQVDENGMRKVQGRYLNDDQIVAYEVDADMLKGDPKKLAQACFIAMHQPDDDDPTQLVQYQELSADNLKEYKQRKNFEKQAQSAIALANFEKLEQKQAPDQAEAPAPVASYDDLSKQQKKMLHSLPTHIKDITNKVMEHEDMLIVTNGAGMQFVPFPSGENQGKVYDKKGNAIPHQEEADKKRTPTGAQFKALLQNFKENTRPAFTLTADQSKKLKDLIANTKNLDDTTIVFEATNSSFVTNTQYFDIRMNGETIATVQGSLSGLSGKSALTSSYFAHALTNGANTIHLDNDNSYIMITNKDVQSCYMQKRFE
jgi:hypothetical protein